MVPIYRVILAPKALDDLTEILDYIGRRSPLNAARVNDQLQAATLSLHIFPQRYSIFLHSRRPEYVIRAMPFASWVIYYRTIEESKIVRVLNIRRGARRRPRSFDN